jgi:hypothetical protein
MYIEINNQVPSSEELQKLTKQTGAKGVIRVTMTVDYLIPSHETNSLEVVAKRWFEDVPPYQRHAYRDNCKIGYSERVVNCESLDL